MKLTKKSGGVVAAVVMAGGLTAASASSAFASAPAHGPKTIPVAKDKDADQHKTAKTDTGRHHRTGTHGERTVKGEDGKTVVHEWQIGTVTAVSGNTVTVKSTDGFTMTWTTGSAAKVRAGDRGTQAKVGDKVLVEGVKAGAVNQARVVVDRTAQQDDRTADEQGDDKNADRDGKGQHDTDKAPTGKHRKPGAPQPGSIQTGEGTGQRDA